MNAFRRRSAVIFALVFAGLGVALIVRTASVGGGVIGFVLGFLFLALGCGRLYLIRRR